MKRYLVPSILAVMALGVCACGSSAVTPTTSTTAAVTTTTTIAAPTTAQLAARFLRIIAPYNAEVTILEAKYPKGVTNTSQMIPLIAPETAVDSAVLRIGLTGQAAIDARSLVTADEAMIVDIQISNWSAWEQAGAALDAADNALRADLGLPPAPS